MGGKKTDFAVLFKAQEALAMKNSIQFWLAHFKSDTKWRDKQGKYKWQKASKHIFQRALNEEEKLWYSLPYT